MPKTPSYRQRTGYSQAIVTLTDPVTKRRKDFSLGEYGSTASREAYHRVVAEWEANGRRWPRVDVVQPVETGDSAKIKVIITAYWRWAKDYYADKHVQSLRGALRVMRKYYGDTPAVEFGPNKLRLLRDEMVRGDANDDPPRKPWCRKYINAQVQCIRHMFKWAAARELVDASVYVSLASLEPLRRGSSGVRESAKVEPVEEHLLDATLPHLSRPVRAVVELQLLTGARPGELLGLRPIDIEIDDEGGVWTYRPEVHKNAHREQERIIHFGPRAQAVLRPFLTDRPTDAYMFSPREAEEQRLAALHASRNNQRRHVLRIGLRRSAPQLTCCVSTRRRSWNFALRRCRRGAASRSSSPVGSTTRRSSPTPRLSSSGAKRQAFTSRSILVTRHSFVADTTASSIVRTARPPTTTSCGGPGCR